MATPLVLTFVGRDKPGLVNAISEKIAAHGGTWLESRLSHLAGEFAGIVLVGAPEPNIAALTAALRDLEASGLRVTVDRSESVPTGTNYTSLTLALFGNERPGIVRDLTQALTGLGVNIEEFSSSLESAPFTGLEMFRANARLRIPSGVSGADVQKTLEELAAEIMVDLTVSEAPSQPN
jgi:glycine cleavage system regulatory protein